jgi:hypothetical protein
MPEFLQVLLMGSVATAVIRGLAGLISWVFLLWIARVMSSPSRIVADSVELTRQAANDGEFDEARERVGRNGRRERPDTTGRVIYIANVLRHRNLRPAVG